MKYDVIVLGGGVIGAATAFELAKTGAKVLILERKQHGFGASGHTAALLEFQIDSFKNEPFFSLAQASRRLFPQLVEDIKNTTQLDIQYESNGILQLALTDEDVAAIKTEVERQKSLGLSAQWLDAEQILKEAPAITADQKGGAYFKEDGQVHGEKFLKALMKAAELKGAVLFENVNTVAFRIEDKKITGVLTNRGLYKANHYVVATGAWTDELIAPLGLKLGIEPVKGQLLFFDTPEPILPFPVYTKDKGYIASKKDRSTLVGSTVERVGFDLLPTEKARAELAMMAYRLVPVLQKKPIRRMTAGLRPASPDDLPFIGSFPEYPQIIFATGHFRNGILLAPITGQIVKDLVKNNQPALPVEPFLPTRIAAPAHA